MALGQQGHASKIRKEEKGIERNMDHRRNAFCFAA